MIYFTRNATREIIEEEEDLKSVIQPGVGLNLSIGYTFQADIDEFVLESLGGITAKVGIEFY